MNEIMNINGIECYEKDGVAYLKLDAVARGLGFTQEKNGVEYVKWERVNAYLSELKFSPEVGKDSFIPENIFYRLAMKAKNEAAEKFQAFIADEVIPSIRKTGGYMVNQEQLSPELRLLINLELKQKQHEAALEAVNRRVDNIGEIIALDTKSWRDNAHRLIVGIAQAMGGVQYIADVNKEIYRLVDQRAAASLETRLTNKRRRMAEDGVCKSRRDRVSKLDVIADDKRLMEIYVAIVKEMAVKYGVTLENA